MIVVKKTIQNRFPHMQCGFPGYYFHKMNLQTFIFWSIFFSFELPPEGRMPPDSYLKLIVGRTILILGDYSSEVSEYYEIIIVSKF